VRAVVNTTRATRKTVPEKVEDFARRRDLQRRASTQVSATRFGLTHARL
jgi:hypothetical protein